MSWGFHILIYAGVIYLGICLIYYVIQEKLIFVPNHISDFKKYRFVHPFEGRFFDTSDEGKIHSLHFKVENSKGLLLYLHGNTGSDSTRNTSLMKIQIRYGSGTKTTLRLINARSHFRL